MSDRNTWTMPEPPEPGLVPCAHPVGPPDEVWHLYWARIGELNEPADVESPDIGWPFGSELWADSADMARAGFTIVDGWKGPQGEGAEAQRALDEVRNATPGEYAALAELEKQATRAPWSVDRRAVWASDDLIAHPDTEADAALIAAARNALPDLLRDLDVAKRAHTQAEALNVALRREVDGLKSRLALLEGRAELVNPRIGAPDEERPWWRWADEDPDVLAHRDDGAMLEQVSESGRLGWRASNGWSIWGDARGFVLHAEALAAYDEAYPLGGDDG